MKQAVIYKIEGDRPDFRLAEELEVDEYPWGCPWDDPAVPGRRPTVTAKLLLSDAGLHVLLACDEASPRATFFDGHDPICQDSCLEFFVNAAPDKGPDYINFECNANGALWCAFGPDRGHRQFFSDLGLKEPEVTVRKSPAGWAVEYLVSQEIFTALYGRPLEGGCAIRANFYKCGDACEVPHYAVWNHIEAPQPDYHRPECFGELSIVEVK